MKKLDGKVAVVTGASKGIGAEIARQLASEGAAVAVNYASSKAGAEKVVQDIESAGGRAVAVQADVSKADEIEGLFAEVKRVYGAVDILVNNAGVYEFAPLEDITEDHFHRQFNINVLGLILTTQQAVKHFGLAGGSIVNISSIASTYAMPNATVYSATKAAVDTVTRVLSKELGPRKIRVNAVNPGMVETEGTHAQGIPESEMHAMVESQTPLGRTGQPDDIAPAVVFLTSPDSAWITGETLYIGGGFG